MITSITKQYMSNNACLKDLIKLLPPIFDMILYEVIKIGVLDELFTIKRIAYHPQFLRNMVVILCRVFFRAKNAVCIPPPFSYIPTLLQRPKNINLVT